MKKIAAIAVVGLCSVQAQAADFSDIGGSVGAGFQTSSVDTNYGECWQECFGSQEPTGFALEGTVNFGPLFVNVDWADLEQNEGAYDEDEIDTMWSDTSFGLGYSFALNDSAAIVLALQQSDVEWEYEYSDPNGDAWIYSADDSGLSYSVGATVDVSERMTAGANISMGFAEGLDVYALYSLTDNLAVKASVSNHAYELENFEYNANGSLSDPSDENGDGDYQVDTQMMRVGFHYGF